MRSNILVVIENGILTAYCLDDKLNWEVGRVSAGNKPDIAFHSETTSRKHGTFVNSNGTWIYKDKYGKNGTIYNGKHVDRGLAGHTRPKILKNGDVLIFGGGEEPVINSKTVWALFCEEKYGDVWSIEDTKDIRNLKFTDGSESKVLSDPPKGSVVYLSKGIAIYMGDVTYICGNISVQSAGQSAVNL